MLTFLEEETSREVQQVPRSPTSPTSEDTSSEIIATRTRSLQDLYDNTKPLSQRRLEDIYVETEGMDNPTLSCLSASNEPVNFEEAAKKKRWRNPTDKEVQGIKKDNMRYNISIPKDHKAINGKWMNKTKKNVKRKFKGHKARLMQKATSKRLIMIRCLSQVAHLDIIKHIIYLTSQHKLRIYRIDVKCSFLFGVLEEE